MQIDARLLDRAKRMRREMTQPERELWMTLRAKRLGGVKFARQVVLGRYIVDFVARAERLVVEVDGDTHVGDAHEAERTCWLQGNGYRVLRFGNGDVMTNLPGVLQTIQAALSLAPLPTLSPEGRGLSPIPA